MTRSPHPLVWLDLRPKTAAVGTGNSPVPSPSPSPPHSPVDSIMQNDLEQTPLNSLSIIYSIFLQLAVLFFLKWLAVNFTLLPIYILFYEQLMLSKSPRSQVIYSLVLVLNFQVIVLCSHDPPGGVWMTEQPDGCPLVQLEVNSEWLGCACPPVVSTHFYFVHSIISQYWV